MARLNAQELSLWFALVFGALLPFIAPGGVIVAQNLCVGPDPVDTVNAHVLRRVGRKAP